ncbi:MAG: glycosyltransferase family 4 protein [Candidatus Nanoarchaeia archaeon]|nr:glycosyltransferase family 4 protein [Candidatus Jingweiarchaeum tengchongense]
MEQQEKRINVVYIIGKFGIGGIETLIYKMARHLDRRFFYPTIIGLNDYVDKVTEDQIISSLTKEDIEVLKLSGSTKNHRLQKILFIRKNLRGRKNVVIHTNSDIVNTVMATWKMKIPLVNTYHSGIGWSKKDRITYKIFMQKRFKKIVAVSNSVKQAIEKTVGIEASKIKVIYNGIEIEKFNANPKIMQVNQNNKVKLICVGRLAKEKGFEYLLEALRHVNSNLTLYIVGDGDLREELNEFVVKNKLEKEVMFLGAIDNDQIPKILWSADIYVMPSLYEGFSVSLIEAMAAGKPVLISNIAPFREMLGIDCMNSQSNYFPTDYGVMFKAGDSVSLFNAIEWMLDNKDKWEEFGKNSYERAKIFDISKTVREYEQIYKEIVKL